MLEYACKDLGLDCDFVTTGATVDEVIDKAFAHAAVAHADILNGMNEAEKAQLKGAVEAKIKPA